MLNIINSIIMRKIAFVNHKGGVGKTTSAANVAAAMALNGKRVLVIDTDPQGNLTDALGGIEEGTKTIYNAFKGAKLRSVIKQVKNNLDLVPCNLDFAGIEVEISNRLAREKFLEELIKPMEKDYDICIIDCPPSLGIITVNVLVATNEVYVPMQAEAFSFRGLDSIISIINEVKKHYNDTLKVSGVFIANFKAQRVITKEIGRQLEKSIGSVLMQSRIRTNVTIAEAQTFGKDVFEYDSKSNGAFDYMKLTKEILNK